MQALGDYLEAIVTALSFSAQRFWREYTLALVSLIAFFALGYYLLLSPPSSFPLGTTISISHGESLPAISSQLATDHIIAHPRLFSLIVRIAGGAGRVQAGPYRFTQPTDLITVAERLLRGVSGIPLVRLTIVEGLSVREMSGLIAKSFPDISASDFIAAGGGYEGYLFPDTYKFSASATAEQVVATMHANFDTRIATIEPDIVASGHSLSDIVIMASLVEKEAQTPADKKIVAGILWARIAKGIPLQVDAPFGFLQGRAEYSPSLADLSIDSPYNTYQHKGLPPGPIGNPGLDSLEAAANPTKTNYLFYLTGSDGLMHYAVTFAQHKANRTKYIK